MVDFFLVFVIGHDTPRATQLKSAVNSIANKILDFNKQRGYSDSSDTNQRIFNAYTSYCGLKIDLITLFLLLSIGIWTHLESLLAVTLL